MQPIKLLIAVLVMVAALPTMAGPPTATSRGPQGELTAGISDRATGSAADGATRTRYESVRTQSFSEWWQMPVVVLACAAVLLFVALMYRRDSVELKPGIGVLLAVLRLAAFAGLLLMYLDIERRTEVKVIHNSRVVLLVDTSLSMSRVDADDAGVGAASANGTGSGRRIDQVSGALEQGALLDALRRTHDVEVIRFDSDSRRIASLQKFPRYDAAKDDAAADGATKNADKIDWRAELDPQGGETRIGQAVRQIIDQERGVPLSAIVLFSDGGQNAGVDVAAAIKTAQDAKVPVHAIGIGSPNRPTNVRVADLVAPPRAYPGDSFQVTGYIQSQGLSGRSVSVELAVLEAGQEKSATAEPSVEKTERVSLGGDSEVIPVKFDIPGFDAAGKRVVRLRIKPIPEDKDLSDNQREVDVDIVDRKNKVLLFAGGPTREYQFLRNMLRRSELAKRREMTIDVLLQSASEDVSQDAATILDHFPRTMQELSEYDTIMAFDPD